MKKVYHIKKLLNICKIESADERESEKTPVLCANLTDVNYKTIEYNIASSNGNNGKKRKKLIMIFSHNLKCDPRDENYYTLNFIFQFFSRVHLQSRVFCQ